LGDKPHYTPIIRGVKYYERGVSENMAGSGKPTKKQRKFVERVVEGDSLADAYREAYDAEGSSAATIRKEAHNLSRRPHIARMVEAARADEARAVQRDLGLRRRWIVSRLVEEADAAPSDSARVRALELLAKQAGLFASEAERSEKRLGSSEAELVAELESRLGAMVPAAEAIEVQGSEQVEGDEGAGDDPPPPLGERPPLPHTSHRDLHIESPLSLNDTPLGDIEEPLDPEENLETPSS
jgi:hypothetical protein